MEILSVNTYTDKTIKKLEKGDEYFQNIDPVWKKKVIGKLLKNEKINLITKQIDEDINDEATILPYPKYVFYAFKLTPYDNVKVVFIGQDPYHGVEIHVDNKTKEKYVAPQSMGACFSVATGIKIPSSLKNILNNQIKYGHIDKMPNHGNLEEWAKQGCLLLNTALTVRYKEPNCHAKAWSWFTDAIITHLSEKKPHLIFVLWGKPALNKKSLIDESKHTIIISSHPSGLSAHNKLGNYPSFNENDHFKQINDDLVKNNYEKIDWKLTDI